MLAVLNFIQQILSTPAIFVGLIALLGLLLQKQDMQSCIKGTVKTILGFIVLSAGANVVQQAIVPFGNLFQIAFHVEGVVPNNEAITSLGLTDYAVQTASIFALGMCFNIILARFSKLKFIFLTGHHALYMSCLIAILTSIAGLDGVQQIVTGALLLGLVMSIFPALMQPTIEEITGDDSLALGHFGSGCYWLSAQIGKLFGRDDDTTTTEDVDFPQGLSFLRENTISIALQCSCATSSYLQPQSSPHRQNQRRFSAVTTGYCFPSSIRLHSPQVFMLFWQASACSSMKLFRHSRVSPKSWFRMQSRLWTARSYSRSLRTRF